MEITKPFYHGVYEVTQEEYEKVMGRGTNPSWFTASGGGKDKVDSQNTSRFPVENVSHEDAVKFCKKLSAMSKEKAAKRSYRLPTEAEWEYSCRGGVAFKTPFDLNSTLSSTKANFSNSKLDRTCKVGSYGPNGYGLYDMQGNVWEWCSDWYDKDYYARSPSKDPPGPSAGSRRVDRGGSWRNAADDCAACSRDASIPSARSGSLGFRLLLNSAND